MAQLWFPKAEDDAGGDAGTGHGTVTEVLPDVVGLDESNPHMAPDLDVEPTTECHGKCRLREY